MKRQLNRKKDIKHEKWQEILHNSSNGDPLEHLEGFHHDKIRFLDNMMKELNPTSVKSFQYTPHRVQFFDLLMEDDKILNLEDRIINIIMDVFLKFKNNSFYFSLLILSMHTTFLSYTALKKNKT